MKRRGLGKSALLLLVAALFALFFLYDLDSYLTLESLKARQAGLDALLDRRPVAVAGAFFLIYVLVTALSVPGAVVLTIAGGAIFGLVAGTIIVSFASTLGASLAFLTSRYILRDWVNARFARRIAAIDRGIERDGPFYLLTLRLIPIFPFFIVNLAMGVTGMRLLTFAAVSQAGMLAGTIIYVNAGTELAEVRSAEDILSPELLISLLLLAIFPLLARRLDRFLKARRAYKGFRRPRHYDRNLIVIGAGAAGLVTAYIAATLRAKVTLIEANRMGGDCLNTGCVPSKALIRSARAAHEVRTAAGFGVEAGEPTVDFRRIMARIRSVIATIEPADSVERYTGLGVDVRLGRARILDPWTVEIDGTERLTARSIVIAAGAEPFAPAIPGLDGANYLTSETMWDALERRGDLPPRLAVIGGGPIGVEMAQAFARLGSRVTLVEQAARILATEDEEASALIEEVLRSEGVDVRTGSEALRCESGKLVVGRGRGEESIEYDEILIAVGRRPRLSGYGLEELGIGTGRTVGSNEYLETLYPNIFAAGDVVGPYQFTHAASHQAWHAAVNALFGGLRRFRVDHSLVPRTVFTDPELASVGHGPATAAAEGIDFEVVRYDLSHLDRAVTDGARKGFVKLLVEPGRGRILGATIVASNAGELLAEIVLAMKHGLGLNKLLGTIHAYPTMAEATLFAAGEWKKAHKPERLLKLLEVYHRWRRG